MTKKRYKYSGYGITFYSAGFWIFDNDTARNFIIFGVDNSLSSHCDNHKNNFLVIGEYTTFELMKGLVYQRKNLVLILVKQTQNFV